ncbi:hypothetical protein [Sporolactobacillus terrae]|uniref:hypothetical protein n=1 Tax=Sporolactobacillus terrae TaxID=269673 RepID=UPI00111B8DB6|nr:hypothetical protein [Sporolactobacillus terrae]
MVQLIMTQMIFGLVAIMVGLVIVKFFFRSDDLLLLPSALALALFYTAFIEKRIWLSEGAWAAMIYGLSAFGLYMLVKRLAKLYRSVREGPFH